MTLAGPVTVVDDKATVTCPSGGLAPGAFTTCTASYTITQADLNAGSVTNTAKATANATDSNEDSETVTANQTKTLSLDKTASPSTYSTVGQTISYSYKVTNTGNVTLAGPVTVTDDKATVTCPTGGLAPGAFKTCTASYTITQADLDAGSVKNTAQAHANGIDSNEDSETVTANQSKTLSLTKSASPVIYNSSGTVITYSYVIKNTGNVTLSGPFTISDDKTSVSCTQPGDGKLSPNETMNCSATYTITAADVTAGSVTNKATATNGTVTSNEATATVRKTVDGQVTPTATTCQEFANSTAANLTDEFYGVKGSSINNVSPGVFFYYSRIKAPAAAFTIKVSQSDTLSWKKLLTQQLILWDSSCRKTAVTGTYSSATGEVTFSATGLTSGATYIVSIKYDPGSVVGQHVPGKPTDVYTFVTSLNGAAQVLTTDSVNFKPRP